MIKLNLALLATAAAYPSVAVAQQSGWTPDQVNATMCFWSLLRGQSSPASRRPATSNPRT